MDYIKSTRIINDFMGIDPIEEDKYEALDIISALDMTMNPCVHFNSPLDSVDIEDFKYNSSYDWIMPVVKEIEELTEVTILNRKQYDYFKISGRSIEFYFSKKLDFKKSLHLELRQFVGKDPWKHGMYSTHIIKEFDFKNKGLCEGLFAAVVEFLKWYEQL